MGKQNIECDDLVLGNDVKIEKDIIITGGKIILGDNVKIGKNVTIDVKKRIVIGKNSIIRDNCVIRGVDIELGREFYTAGKIEMGGGSCFEDKSKLKIGYWFHAGRDTFINTSRCVEIGNEVGIRGNIYTHGGYLSVIDGFPSQWGEVHIGNHVWMPYVTVHPSVNIGDNVVIAAGSIVTEDIPSGAFAAGVPCKVVDIRYPMKLSIEEIDNIIGKVLRNYGYQCEVAEGIMEYEGASFNCINRVIEGDANHLTEQLRDRLRRYGIRFKVDVEDEKYVTW